MTKTEVSQDVLIAVKNRLRGHYLKYTFKRLRKNDTNDTCAVCLDGAINWVFTGDAAKGHAKASAVTRFLQQFLPPGFKYCCSFNDHWKTRESDVLALLDRAIYYVANQQK